MLSSFTNVVSIKTVGVRVVLVNKLIYVNAKNVNK